VGCEDTSGSTIREPYALKHIVSYTKSRCIHAAAFPHF
jgi:hypothetical protein